MVQFLIFLIEVWPMFTRIFYKIIVFSAVGQCLALKRGSPSCSDLPSASCQCSYLLKAQKSEHRRVENDKALGVSKQSLTNAF